MIDGADRAERWVWRFGMGGADGGAAMKDLLGGKGANLAEMCQLGLPVPPGFTLTTAVCERYLLDRRFPPAVEAQLGEALAAVETAVGRRFGDAARRPCWCPCAPARGPRCPG